MTVSDKWLRHAEKVFTFPSFAWMFLFFAIPTAILTVFSFKPSDLYGNIAEGWTLDHWFALFSPTSSWIIWKTLWLSGLTTVFSLLLALPVAYCLVRMAPLPKQLVLLAIVIPFWSSLLIRIIAWKAFLHPEGLFKELLVSLHIVSPNASLLYNNGAVLLVMVYSYLPFAILPLYAAASKFDFSLREAALDLGCTRFQAFCKVFIPSLWKGIATAALMIFIPAVGSYVIPDLVGGTSSEMIGNKIAQKIFIERNLPQASALAVFLALILLFPMVAISAMRKSANPRRDFK